MALSNWDTFAVTHTGEPIRGAFKSPNGIVVEVYKNQLYIHDDQSWTDTRSFTKPVVLEVNSGTLQYKDVHVFAVRGPKNGVYFAVWSTQYHENTKEVVDGIEKEVYVPPTYTGMVGIGCYGYGGPAGDDWVGVEQSDIDFLKEQVLGKKVTITHCWHTSYSYRDDEPLPKVGDARLKNGKVISVTVKDGWVNLEEEVIFEEHSTDVPEVLQNLDVSKGLRYNQGDAYLADHAGQDVPASEPGEAEEPVIKDIIEAMKGQPDNE